MSRKVWVTGAGGQLGRSFLSLFPQMEGFTWLPTTREQVDLSDQRAVQIFLEREAPEAILNFAAFTAVDLAEHQKEAALRINAELPLWLADYAKEHCVLLIHISTDHLFGREEQTTPYREEDQVAPINYYGESKHLGEVAITTKELPHFYILRTAWLYSPTHLGKSFYRSILQNARAGKPLCVVTDEVGSPTSTFTLAKVVAELLQLWQTGQPAPKGIYHVTDKGAISRHQFAEAIVALDPTLAGVKVGKCLQADLQNPARRPHYSALCTEKIEQLLPHLIPTWQEALKEVYSNEKEV